MSGKKITYKDSGVDIDAGERFVELIKPYAVSTYDDNVLGGIGGFSGFYSLPVKDYADPVLVSATDGVGTKLKLAFMSGRFDTIGIDLVAMCVNDLVTSGAKPLFFLDYLATSKLEPQNAAEIVKGIAQGCREAGCALLGGETAEMPGFYATGEFDVAGFAVGVVERDKIIDGSKVAVEDNLIGLASSGLHSNGYSLARKAFFDESKDELKMEFSDIPKGFNRSIGDMLLEPTRIYVKPALDIIGRYEVKSLAHITGGGFYGNIPRAVPDDLSVVIDPSSWEIDPLFALLKESAKLDWSDMFETFNCGIGMVLVVGKGETARVLNALRDMGESPFVIGEVVEREGDGPRVVIE